MSATDMTLLTDEQARIAGAMACMEHLRKLEQAAERINDIDDSAQQFYDKCYSDCATFAVAVGPIDPRSEGVILTLAEYIHQCIQSGQPNTSIGGWVPMASMTEAQRQAHIEEFQHFMDSEGKEAGKGNVVYLHPSV